MRKVMNYRRFLWTAGFMLVLFLALFSLLSGRLNARQEEETALRRTLIRLEDENASLDAQLQLVDTEDYIVSSAMTNYAFMNRNDLRFQFTNPEALYAYTEQELKILMDEMAD